MLLFDIAFPCIYPGGWDVDFDGGSWGKFSWHWTEVSYPSYFWIFFWGFGCSVSKTFMVLIKGIDIWMFVLILSTATMIQRFHDLTFDIIANTQSVKVLNSMFCWNPKSFSVLMVVFGVVGINPLIINAVQTISCTTACALCIKSFWFSTDPILT